MTASGAELREGLVGPLAGLGVDVEDVEVQKAGRRHVVRVVIDRDGGVDLDLVADVSRRASELLDTPPLSDLLPGPFVLEVTSPGVDRPLTTTRHWSRARGRLVHIVRADGSTLDGRVVEVPSDDEVVVATPEGDVTVPRADVRRAVVQVEFNRSDGDSGEGSDDPAPTSEQDEGRE